MTVAPADAIAPSGRGAAVLTYLALAAMTAVEIGLAGASVEPRMKTTALGGLLLAKAGVLLAFSLRASPRRAPPRLALLAVVVAVGFAVVLMLEAVYRAGLR